MSVAPLLAADARGVRRRARQATAPIIATSKNRRRRARVRPNFQQPIVRVLNFLGRADEFVRGVRILKLPRSAAEQRIVVDHRQRRTPVLDAKRDRSPGRFERFRSKLRAGDNRRRGNRDHDESGDRGRPPFARQSDRPCVLDRQQHESDNHRHAGRATAGQPDASDHQRHEKANDATTTVRRRKSSATPTSITSQATRNPASELLRANVAAGSRLSRRASKRNRAAGTRRQPLARLLVQLFGRVLRGFVGGDVDRHRDEILMHGHRRHADRQADHDDDHRPHILRCIENLPREQEHEPHRHPVRTAHSSPAAGCRPRRPPAHSRRTKPPGDQRAHRASRIEIAACLPRSWSSNHAPASIEPEHVERRTVPPSAARVLRHERPRHHQRHQRREQRGFPAVDAWRVVGGSDFRFDLPAVSWPCGHRFRRAVASRIAIVASMQADHRQDHGRTERVDLVQQERAQSASGRQQVDRPHGLFRRTGPARSAGARSDSCRLRTGCARRASESTPPRACRKSARPARTAARTPRAAARLRRRTSPSAWPWRSQKPMK